MSKPMSVNEEFLDNLLEPLLIDSMTGGSKDYQTQELFDETKKAILQHFQQEQERAGLEARIDALNHLEATDQYFNDDNLGWVFVEEKIEELSKQQEGSRNKITKIGIVENGVAKYWEFDCEGKKPVSLSGGYTIEELRKISEEGSKDV